MMVVVATHPDVTADDVKTVDEGMAVKLGKQFD